jgi:hypothetical protein
VKACKAGVERSHIIPFATDGSLLLEVYVHDGIGTMVVDEKLEELREATADDVGGILQLIEPFEKDGTLVKRDRTEIERDIANYTIVEHDGVIFACAALYPYPEAKTGEMAALTVSPQSQGQGDGEKVLRASSSAPARWAWTASSCSPPAPCTGSSSAASCRSTPTGCPRRASASTTGTGAAWCSSRSSSLRPRIKPGVVARPQRFASLRPRIRSGVIARPHSASRHCGLDPQSISRLHDHARSDVPEMDAGSSPA